MDTASHFFTLPILMTIGLIVIIGFYIGRAMKYIKLPSIIGFMVLGVILGPSLVKLLGAQAQQQLSFMTEIALGFVALSIGLELRLSVIKKMGAGIIYVILFESFAAFLLVFVSLLLLTGDLPLALIFGAVAPASAPAGTVAIIHEYKAKGSLTRALYAVVGFDDGLGIIIFGFAAAFARMLLLKEAGSTDENIWIGILMPLKEVFLSLVFGGIMAYIFSFFVRRLENSGDVLILIVGFVLLSCGLCQIFHLSLILTNMIIGMIVVNTQPNYLIQKLHDRLPVFMPLLFIIFFTLAGANLHISALSSLGLLGVIYIIGRSCGLVFGSKLGAIIGKADANIRKYLGLGILSQAGVAIGLSLIVKHEFQGLGKVVEITENITLTTGDILGTTVLTTVTATCIFFEIIGPILTKYALKKAGEIAAD